VPDHGRMVVEFGHRRSLLEAPEDEDRILAAEAEAVGHRDIDGELS
jgi:hypothetical protein